MNSIFEPVDADRLPVDFCPSHLSCPFVHGYPIVAVQTGQELLSEQEDVTSPPLFYLLLPSAVPNTEGAFNRCLLIH